MTRRRHFLLDLARRRSHRAAATALFLVLLGIACTRAEPRPPLDPVGLPALSRLEPAVRTEIERRATRVEELVARATTPATELAEAYGSLGRVLDAHELPGAAARCYTNAGRLAPGEFSWPYLHGQLALATGATTSTATAKAAFSRALEISPDQPLALVGAARAAALAGDWEESRRLAERALGRDPGLALAWSVLGNAQLGGGDAAGAATSLRRALQLQPAATRIHGQLATALARAGDAVGSQAEERLRGEGILAIDDPWLQQVADERLDAVGRRAAGERLFLAGDLANALVEFEAATAAAPDDPESRVGLGSALARSGRWPEAADQYREALRRAPDHALAHFNLAVAVQQLAATAERRPSRARRRRGARALSRGARAPIPVSTTRGRTWPTCCAARSAVPKPRPSIPPFWRAIRRAPQRPPVSPPVAREGGTMPVGSLWSTVACRRRRATAVCC